MLDYQQNIFFNIWIDIYLDTLLYIKQSYYAIKGVKHWQINNLFVKNYNF